jgi:Ala-tRNA(Pro) deacylase
VTDRPGSGRLADGSAPFRPEDLFRRLAELDIEVRTVTHPPVFTVEESKALRGTIAGCHTKNLFLRNKKGAMWLVVCLENRRVDLKDLATRLGAGRLSFGSPDRLMQYLGVIPGAVTPFALINDKGRQVRVTIDREVFDNEPLNFHPLDNGMTTSIGAAGLRRFLEAEGHSPELLDFG